MKDYIVFFTEGFDNHTIEKQKKEFPSAHISCINTKPDYEKLIAESKVAQEHNFDNFYIFWEANDVPDMNFELALEFAGKFKEVRAIPYKYNRILENDVTPRQNTVPVSGTQPVAPNPVPNTNTVPVQNASQVNTQQQPVNSTQTTAQPQEQEQAQPQEDLGQNADYQVSQGTNPNRGNALTMYNTQYTKEHTATIFIWPFNLFFAESWAQNAWGTFGQAIRDDDISLQMGNKTTSNTYHNKKGSWQRIIYIPPSLKELNQGVARADTMYKFTLDTLQNYPFDQGTALPNFKKLLGYLHTGGSKVEYGLLSESDIINACRRVGVSGASIRNIHILYPKPYEKFLTWCPENHRSEISSVYYPNIDHNARQLQALEEMAQFVSSHMQDKNYLRLIMALYNKKEPQGNKYQNFLGDGTANDNSACACFSKLVEHIDKYKPFWDYWNLYISQNDVYGRPDGSGRYDSITAMDGIKNIISDIDQLKAGDHANDMDAIYKAAGWLPKNTSTSEFGHFGGKALMNNIDRTLSNIGIIKKNLDKVQIHGNNGQPVEKEDTTEDFDVPIIGQPEEEKQTTIVGQDPNKVGNKDTNKPNNAEENKENVEDKPENNEAESTENKSEEAIEAEKTNSAENSEEANKENSDENAEKDSESSEESEEDTNGDDQISTNGSMDILINHILCQLSPTWCPEGEGAVSQLLSDFYSKRVLEKFEHINEDGGFTMQRVKVIREYLAANQTVSVNGQAEDGETPDGTTLAPNVKLNPSTNAANAQSGSIPASNNIDTDNIDPNSRT